MAGKTIITIQHVILSILLTILFRLFLWDSVLKNIINTSSILVESLSCVDDAGNQVDYYIGYKVPKLEKSKDDHQVRNGVRYIYWASNEPYRNEWTISRRSINDSKSMFGATIKPLIEKDDLQNSGYSVIFYNDQKPPIRTRVTSTGAHAKGVLAFYGKTGFWLLHSIPQFPVPAQPYEYPKRSLNNGQTFMCISLSTDDQQTMETILDHLKMIKPNIYLMSLTKAFQQKFPTYMDLQDRKKCSTGRTNYFIEKIKSRDGKTFHLFSKNKAFNQDLYSELIAPLYQRNFYVQTWRNGAGEILNSVCNSDYKIINVDEIKLNNHVKWQYREDHAKWAISTERPLVCLSDINRMKSQFQRGGGSICIESSNIWQMFRSIILDVEGCPAYQSSNSKSNPPSLQPSFNKPKSSSKVSKALNWIESLAQRAWKKLDSNIQKQSSSKEKMCQLKKREKVN